MFLLSLSHIETQNKSVFLTFNAFEQDQNDGEYTRNFTFICLWSYGFGAALVSSIPERKEDRYMTHEYRDPCVTITAQGMALRRLPIRRLDIVERSAIVGT